MALRLKQLPCYLLFPLDLLGWKVTHVCAVAICDRFGGCRSFLTAGLLVAGCRNVLKGSVLWSSDDGVWFVRTCRQISHNLFYFARQVTCKLIWLIVAIVPQSVIVQKLGNFLLPMSWVVSDIGLASLWCMSLWHRCQTQVCYGKPHICIHTVALILTCSSPTINNLPEGAFLFVFHFILNCHTLLP